ncbi:hypothetical protein CHS0354_030926 [Potamilus streckersoni]|uniref:Uncharacterized protein n=1 Tax=Potamilus streckersoni TaxID=2493646 RepID=A0AAE0RUS1_9BIVA|nr:hypothetical protein CHS0354_030926 [Potamilus streckersoni]
MPTKLLSDERVKADTKIDCFPLFSLACRDVESWNSYVCFDILNMMPAFFFVKLHVHKLENLFLQNDYSSLTYKVTKNWMDCKGHQSLSISESKCHNVTIKEKFREWKKLNYK